VFSQLVPEWVGWFGWPAVVLLVGGSYACGIVCWLPLNPDPEVRPPDPDRGPEEQDYAEPR
jgi:hypothetical protein